MSDNSPQEKIIKLVSSDGKEFEVSINVIRQCRFLNNRIGQLGLNGENEQEDPIPLENVSGETFEKILAYCKYNMDGPVLTDEELRNGQFDVSRWEVEFLNVEQKELYNIMKAAHYLDIHRLTRITCKIVASMVKGKTVEEMRHIFNITNDYTPEEEERIRRDNAWCEIEGPHPQ